MRLPRIAIGIAFLLSACAPGSSARTENLPPTSVSISTHAPQILSTATAQPIPEVGTATPLPAVTRTAVPTFTPATPVPNANAAYKLHQWAPDQADSLIAQISSQLKAAEDDPLYGTVYGFAAYMEKYKYLAFAEMEALLRFPDAPQGETWRWDLCFNLAFSNHSVESPDAPELPCYAKLIENGLNSRQTDIPGLSSWFEAHESRFSFEITSNTPPPGYASSHVISLNASANLWLLEKEGNFRVFGLRSSMFFFRESGSKFQMLDLTGDNYPELVLYFHRATCCNSFSQQFIYELSSGTPKLLSLEDLNGTSTHTTSEYDSYITALESRTELPGFLFESHYGYDVITQPCSLREYDKYYWNGDRFELAETWFGIDKPDKYNDKEFCQFVIDAAKEQAELEVAVKTIGDIRIGDPEATKDQILYGLGEYHARLGDVDKAKDCFTQAIAFQTTSNKSDPRWSKAAQIFLDDYHEESDYYEVCSRVIKCDMRGALQQLIAEIKPDSFLQAPEILRASGILIKSSGFMNFDGGDDIEQWVVVQHPNRSKREFWILVRGSDKTYGFFVAEISTNKPELKEFQGSSIYALMTSNGENLFSLEKTGFAGQPYIMTHDVIQDTDPFMEADYLKGYLVEKPLDDLIGQLMNGGDPAQIRDSLVQLNQSVSFDCKGTDRCDQVQYLLGLTGELLGDEQAALDAYLQLWKEYPESFYTVMVRSKLVSVSP
ncbi:MAG: tetratricopeptide repeat protein [Anaerolineales bacterium]